MTRSRGILPATAAVALTLLAACARPADGTSPGAPLSASARTPESTTVSPAEADDLVIRVTSAGGFVPADYDVGRLPLVSVYGDGRVITPGPETAQAPGNALPNVLVQQLTPERLRQLVQDGLDAGVRDGADLGRPGVADAPSTRITVVTADGPQTVTVEALGQALADDPRLSPGQQSGRAKLKAYVQKLQDLAVGQPAPVPYRPDALAALARPWTNPMPDLPAAAGNTKPWPGPALPGPAVNQVSKTGCVVVSGAQLAPTLAAAKAANTATAWTHDYKKWSVTFRPLLPDEAGCQSLAALK